MIVPQKSYAIHARKKENPLIDTYLRFTARFDLEPLLTRYVDRIEGFFQKRGFETHQSSILGIYRPSKKKPILYDNDNEKVWDHEELHGRLREVWDDPDPAYDESFATSLNHFKYGPTWWRNQYIRAAEISINTYLAGVDLIARGEDARSIPGIDELLTLDRIPAKGCPWVGFLENAPYFWYYDLFHTLAENYGRPAAEERILQGGAEIQNGDSIQNVLGRMRDEIPQNHIRDEFIQVPFEVEEMHLSTDWQSRGGAFRIYLATNTMDASDALLAGHAKMAEEIYNLHEPLPKAEKKESVQTKSPKEPTIRRQGLNKGRNR